MHLIRDTGFRREYGSGDNLGHTFPSKYFNSLTGNHISQRRGTVKEEEDRLKKEQQLFDQFSPVEGSTKTFPPDLLQNRQQQNTPTNVYSQSASEAGSASSWTPQFTFPRKKSKIKNETDVDPVLIESRFAKLLELLNRKKELSRNMSSTNHRKNSLNATNNVKDNHQKSIQKIDDPNSELPFLSGPEIGGGELARQKRKGVGLCSNFWVRMPT